MEVTAPRSDRQGAYMCDLKELKWKVEFAWSSETQLGRETEDKVESLESELKRAKESEKGRERLINELNKKVTALQSQLDSAKGQGQAKDRENKRLLENYEDLGARLDSQQKKAKVDIKVTIDKHERAIEEAMHVTREAIIASHPAAASAPASDSMDIDSSCAEESDGDATVEKHIEPQQAGTPPRRDDNTPDRPASSPKSRDTDIFGNSKTETKKFVCENLHLVTFANNQYKFGALYTALREKFSLPNGTNLAIYQWVRSIAKKEKKLKDTKKKETKKEEDDEEEEEDDDEEEEGSEEEQESSEEEQESSKEEEEDPEWR